MGHVEFEVTAEWSRGEAVGYESLKQGECSEAQYSESSAYWWKVKTPTVMRWTSERRDENRVLEENKMRRKLLPDF